MQDTVHVAKEYFKAWNNHDMSRLSSLFDNSIQLIDWENDIRGKNHTLKLNEKIFELSPCIKAEIIEIGLISPNKIAAQLLIFLDENRANHIRVVDILTFNSDLKISLIEAYKC
jgi:hypothetical protein